ncbi:MAG: DUF5655 domain-containing protein [Gemmataceae bacterium]|nr:DUF5655 domain-containing protein [Gemmataceae bacterium]
MKQLVTLLEQLQAKLERFRKEGLKETPTRTIFIDPILDALGWDVRDPDSVALEYPTVDGKSVDYALKIARDGKPVPVLLVEAKSQNDQLTDVKDITQTTGYAANDGIVWCVLTNGVLWRVYRSVERCPAPEKLMFEVSYDPKDLEGMNLSQVAEQLYRLSREEMAKGTLDAIGEQTFTDSKIRKAVEALVSSPPRVLLNLVRKATGDKSLKPQTVKDSLGRVLAPLFGQFSARMSPTGVGISRSATGRKASKTRKGQLVTQFSENHHTDGKPREVLELYKQLDQFCLTLQPGAIEKRYLAKYIACREGKRTFCTLHLQRGGMRVWLKLRFGDVPNPPDFARDVTKVGHWGTGDFELDISTAQQLTEAEPLIRKSFVEA